MDDNLELDGRPLVDWLRDLNSRTGAVRLRASATLLRAGPAVVPRIVDALSGREDEVMASLWGSVLLQTIYATWLEEHLEILQDAYFHRRGGVASTLFETRGERALRFWVACLCAPHWKTREESALSLRALRHRAPDILEHLRLAIDAEHNEKAKRTMVGTLQILLAVRPASGG